MKNVTLGELVEFVLKYRRGKAFEGYTEAEIAITLLKKSQCGSLLYACNKEDMVCGIVVASIYPEAEIFFVDEILTTERWVIKTFVNIFKERFGKFRLEAQRWKGENRKTPTVTCYDTDKLTRRILNA